MAKKSQIEKFREAAKQLGSATSEARFNAALRAVAGPGKSGGQRKRANKPGKPAKMAKKTKL
jgi:hypothetical protein